MRRGAAEPGGDRRLTEMLAATTLFASLDMDLAMSVYTREIRSRSAGAPAGRVIV